MYYHIYIESTVKRGKSNKNIEYYDFNKRNIDDITIDIVKPFIQKNDIFIDGYCLSDDMVKRILIKETHVPIEQAVEILEHNKGLNDKSVYTKKAVVKLDIFAKDITHTLIKKVKEAVGKNDSTIKDDVITVLNKSKVFIVHGHDDASKESVARFIEKLGFEPIILHEQASSSSTIIEKIEKYTDVGFGIVLYTACDIGATRTQAENLRNRARQNVVFEHGYLIGKIGRKNVCAVIKGDIETPNDISGVVYEKMDSSGGWKMSIAKELKESGYNVDFNNLL